MNLTGQQTRGKSESRSETTPGGAKPTQQTTMPPSRTWLWLLGVLLANYFLARLLMPSPEAPITVPYTFFKEEVGKGNVEAIYSQGESITGRFKAAVSYPPPGQKSAPPSGTRQSADKTGAAPSDDTQTNTDAAVATNSVVKTSRNFATTLPTFVGPGLESFLIDHGVEISAKPIEEGGSPLATFLFGFGPALLFIGFYV